MKISSVIIIFLEDEDWTHVAFPLIMQIILISALRICQRQKLTEEVFSYVVHDPFPNFSTLLF